MPDAQNIGYEMNESVLGDELGVCYIRPMSLTELPQVQALSVREKLELVDEIWKSVSSDLETLEVRGEEKELLDRRWEAFLQAPETALSVDQFNEQLSARRG